MRITTKKEGLTREELACKLGVSAICVSKWLASGRLFTLKAKGRRHIYSKYILLDRTRKPGGGRPRKEVACKA